MGTKVRMQSMELEAATNYLGRGAQRSGTVPKERSLPT